MLRLPAIATGLLSVALLPQTAPVCPAANVLFVRDGNTLNSDEQLRVNDIESWGHTVTTIEDNESEANLLAAAANVDVVYVPGDSTSVGNDFRTITAGLIVEYAFFDNDYGFTTGGGYQGSNRTTISNVDNTHLITSDLNLGTQTIATSSIPTNSQEGSLAPGLVELATNGSSHLGIGVIEIGGQLSNTVNGNSVATGRRVRLPWGGEVGISYSKLNNNGKSILQNAISWAAAEPFAAGKELLFITEEATVLNRERRRIALFKAWGFSVVTLQDSSSQAAYDAALATADVVYACVELTSGDVGYKLREAGVGVVLEDRKLFDEMGMSSGDSTSVTDRIPIDNNTHPITAGYTLSTSDTSTHLVLTTSNQTFGHDAGLIAPGATVLSNPSAGPALLAVEAGAELVDTYNGSNLAAGRRVGLPWGGSQAFQWQSLTADGVEITRRSLDWASQKQLTGLVGRWRLDETSGTTAADSSDQGNDGALVDGPTWNTDGIVRGALSLTTASDHISLPSATLDGATDISFATWIRTTRTGEQTLLSGANSSISNEIVALFTNDTTFRLHTGETNASFVQWSGIPSIADGRWHHVAVVRDDTNDQVTLYLDGVSQGTLSTTLSAVEIDSGRLLLGEEQDAAIGVFDPNQAFAGELDEVYLFREAIDAAGVAELYGLVGYWRLDETSGVTAVDSSAFGVDLTHESTPVWTAGPRGGAATSNGVAAFESPTGAYLDVDEAVSAACFFRLDEGVATQTTEQRLMHCDDLATNVGFSLQLDRPNSSNLLFRVYDGSGFSQAAWDASGLEAEKWHQAAGTYDGLTIRLYVDGQLVATQAHTTGITPSPTRFNLGRSLRGAIDDAVLYNRAMTEREILVHYGLVGHYEFSETAGATASDSSGLGNHGTYVGSPTLGVSSNGNPANGTAAEFDGSNYVAVPTLFDEPESVTIAVWAQPDTADLLGSDLVSLGDYVGIRVDSTASSGNTIAYKYDNPIHINLDSGESHAESGWLQFVAVYNAHTSTLEIYEGGALAASLSGVGAIDWQGLSSSTRIAGRADGDSAYDFSGRLDEVRIYNRALLPEQVRQLYYETRVQGLRILRWVEKR